MTEEYTSRIPLAACFAIFAIIGLLFLLLFVGDPIFLVIIISVTMLLIFSAIKMAIF